MNKTLDRAVQAQEAVNAYLRQGIDESAALGVSVQGLRALAQQAA